jgi:hypothetical protein
LFYFLPSIKPIKPTPSPSFSLFNPLPTSAPQSTYFTVLSFIINFKVNVQRGFSMYPNYEYTSLWSVQPPLLLSLTPSLPSWLFGNSQFMFLCPLPKQVWNMLILVTFTCFCFLSFPKFHSAFPLLPTFYLPAHLWFCKNYLRSLRSALLLTLSLSLLKEFSRILHTGYNKMKSQSQL